MSEEQAAKQTRESNIDTEASTAPAPNLPPPASAAGWQMPEPVFRKTSGYLPQGYESKYSQGEVKPGVEDGVSPASMPRPEGLADIQPQPEIHDTDEMKLPVASQPVAAAPKKSGGSKVILILLALMIAVALVGAVLAAAYFLYYSQIPADPF